MKRLALLTLFFAVFSFTFLTHAQHYVHQVLVLNEGRFDYLQNQVDVPVSLGVYEPATGSYTVADVIPEARFASDVIVAGDYVFVAADTLLLRYDRYTLQRNGQQTVPGIRKLAFWHGKVLVSRGDVIPLDAYFQVYDAQTLQPEYALTPSNSGIQHPAEGIVVIGDSAYVAVNNGFGWPPNPVGYVAVVDLNQQSYKRSIDLGPDGKNPDNLMTDGNRIFSLNNNDFTKSTVSTLSPQGGGVQTVSLGLASGCGTSMYHAGTVLYQALFDVNNIIDRNLGRFNPMLSIVDDTIYINRSAYGMADDTVNQRLYVAETDFSTYGMVLVYDYNWNLKDVFVADVSPGTIVFDVREMPVGITEIDKTVDAAVYPNPAGDYFTVVASATGNIRIEVKDVTGRLVAQRHTSGNGIIHQQFDITGLDAGTYFVTLYDGTNTITRKFVKY